MNDRSAQDCQGGAFDLLIRAGRVVCPAAGLDTPGAVAVSDGRIAAAGPDAGGEAREVLEFPHGLLLPGLVDLHAHPAVEGSKYGVDPDVEFLPRGVTTVLSQGDAGAANWRRYRETTIEKSRCRVRLAVNLAAPGASKPGPCFENLGDVDVDACVAAIEEGGDLIWGISVDTSRHNFGEGPSDPREVIRRALQAAERTGRPILYGMRTTTDMSFEEQLAPLRPGDVVTYCYRREPHCIVENGLVHPAVHRARERGVLFDLGHGKGSFDFAVAEAALADGFPPDTISTDKHRGHRGEQPPHDLPRTMAKLIAAGMPEADVLAAVTSRPAQILRLETEIGSLTPGTCADMTVLNWREDAAPLSDVYGEERPGGCWEAALTIRAGRIINAGP